MMKKQLKNFYFSLLLASLILVQFSSIDCQSLQNNKINGLSFGRNLRSLFQLDPSYTNLNHGSYGSIPTSVQHAREDYMLQCEWNPDVWMRDLIENKLADVRKLIAKYVNAQSPDELVFVENASDGINAAAKSFDWKKGDKILRSSISYPMVQKVLKYLEDKFQTTTVIVNFEQKTLQTTALILEQYKLTVEKTAGQIKLAIIDHISSVPSLVFPIKEIVNYLHSKNIAVIIDGAHAVGNIRLNVTDYGAEFYTSNFHKWGYSSKTASFLWINKAQIKQTHPNIIGNLYGSGLQKEFFWSGTRDFSAYLSVADALKFRDSLGDQEIIDYMHDLATTVGEKVTKIWNTTNLVADPNMHSALITVHCPTDNATLASLVQTKLRENDNTSLVVFSFDNKVFTRLSCQIYNDLSDFETMATKFLEYMHQFQNQEILH